MSVANKALMLTMPALGNFCIMARHNGLGGGFGCVLPVRALAWPHNAGVSAHLADNNMHQHQEKNPIERDASLNTV